MTCGYNVGPYTTIRLKTALGRRLFLFSDHWFSKDWSLLNEPYSSPWFCFFIWCHVQYVLFIETSSAIHISNLILTSLSEHMFLYHSRKWPTSHCPHFNAISARSFFTATNNPTSYLSPLIAKTTLIISNLNMQRSSRHTLFFVARPYPYLWGLDGNQLLW